MYIQNVCIKKSIEIFQMKILSVGNFGFSYTNNIKDDKKWLTFICMSVFTYTEKDNRICENKVVVVASFYINFKSLKNWIFTLVEKKEQWLKSKSFCYHPNIQSVQNLQCFEFSTQFYCYNLYILYLFIWS